MRQRHVRSGPARGPDGRDGLLRAHPLLHDNGIINGNAFAPSLVTAGVEATRWIAWHPTGR